MNQTPDPVTPDHRGPDMVAPGGAADNVQQDLPAQQDPPGADVPTAGASVAASTGSDLPVADAPRIGAPGTDDVAGAAVGTAGGATLASLEDARRKPLSPMGRGTLSRRLVVRTAAIVTLIAVVLGLASTLAVRHVLMNNLDTRVHDAMMRSQETARRASDGDDSSSSQSSTSTSGKAGDPPPVATNQVILQKVNGSVQIAQHYTNLSSETLTAAQQSALAADYSTTASTVTLDGLGDYRIQSSSKTVNATVVDSDGVPTGATANVTIVTIVGLPMSEVNTSVRKLVGVEVVLTLVALAAASALSLALVRNSLKPLNRLAATATEVSTLELDRGEVELPTRVPGRDADPNSEVGRVGHAFNHMLNNVEGALAARQHSETKVRQFVADASHELRNPLAAIRGYAELTNRRRDELPTDAAYALDRIQSESNRMSRLVEDMLLLARLDNDPTLELGEVDVVELVLNAVSDAQVAGATHEWAVQLPEVPVVARADALKLHQVVANLLSNARKHTPEGTEVTTGVSVEGRFAVITVTDDGPGIDESVKDHVFERFARADTARAHNKEGSTGLGLAIVAAVMEAHGGSATVDSRPGRTCFTLRVPLA